MSTNNNFEYVGGAGELAGTAYAQPKIMTGMHRTTSSDALHHHHYRNQSATTIQAAFKGYQSRAQTISNLQKECIHLRQLLAEKENALFESMLLVNTKDAQIVDLKKKLKSASPSYQDSAPSLKSSRSTLFQVPTDPTTTSIDSMNEGFYNLQVKPTSDPLYAPKSESRSLIRASSPKWGSQSDLHLKGNDETPDLLRNIWNPIGPIRQPNTLSKSHSVASLVSHVDTSESLSAHNISSAVSESKTSPFSSNSINNTTSTTSHQSSNQILSDSKEMKATFKSLVDKIVKTNDQPCSIFLQQRLKTETAEVKTMIFEAIMNQLLPLMKNRFGNFLVQCCLECGSDEQFIALCLKMRGHVLQLSCDRFGCHVMQKAIEKVRQDIKITLITELYPHIYETFTNRFACHVWQRIFEVQWKDDRYQPPQFMAHVQRAISGKWAAVANDENGSLIVQCIFEHCTYEGKAPIIEELFACIYGLSKGQWGNWVIQHLLEHGSHSEQARIIQIVFDNSFSMSVDQYASKVVEKCVKIAPKKDLYRFVDEITSSGPNREPYILSMMNNQFGNYVVQNVLGVAESAQRDQCVRLLAPYLSILRGSKYGQRVAALCEKYMRMGHAIQKSF